MTTSRSPELERAKALLDEATLAPGARERIYWGVVHKPMRLPRGRWRVSVMVFGWLTAASAAYGLGRIVYLTLPTQVNHPNGPSSATPQASPLEKRRPVALGHSSQTRSVASSENVENPLSLPTSPAADVEPLPPTARMADVPPSPSPARVVDATMPSIKAANESPRASIPNQPFAERSEIATVEPKPRSSRLASASAQASPTSTTPVTAGTSPLSLQVADYQEAVALISQKPHVALERLYAHRRQYPTSAIAHEVDLRIIQSLLALGQTESARAAARSFLKRYPNSARAEEVLRIAESND